VAFTFKLDVKFATLTAVEPFVDTCDRSADGAEKVDLNPLNTKPERKAEAFFISKSKYYGNDRHDVGSMLVRGADPPNPFPLFCKTPFPAFIIEALEVSSTDASKLGKRAFCWDLDLRFSQVLRLGAKYIFKGARSLFLWYALIKNFLGATKYGGHCLRMHPCSYWPVLRWIRFHLVNLQIRKTVTRKFSLQICLPPFSSF